MPKTGSRVAWGILGSFLRGGGLKAPVKLLSVFGVIVMVEESVAVLSASWM